MPQILRSQGATGIEHGRYKERMLCPRSIFLIHLLPVEACFTESILFKNMHRKHLFEPFNYHNLTYCHPKGAKNYH